MSFLAGLLVLSSTVASAEAPTTSHWYGWQTILTDAGAVGLGLAFPDRWVLPVVAYGLGGPTVHALHGQVDRAVGSAALRVTAPFVGGLLGAAALCTHGGRGDDFSCLGGMVLGAMSGVLAASVIDASAISWERSTPTTPRSHLGFSPVLGREQLGVTVFGQL